MRTVRVTGQQAQGDLGQADERAPGVRGDAVVAGQRDLQPTAQGRAVDGGHDGPAEGLQPAQLGLDEVGVLGDLRCVLRAGLDQVVEIAAREEGLLGGGDDDAGDGVLLGLQPVDRHTHGVQVVGVHGVGRLVRVVQGQHDDAVVVGLPADRVRLAHVRQLLRPAR
jgi:hypothetical protein